MSVSYSRNKSMSVSYSRNKSMSVSYSLLPLFVSGYSSLRSQQDREGYCLLPSGFLNSSIVRVILSSSITMESIWKNHMINA